MFAEYTKCHNCSKALGLFSTYVYSSYILKGIPHIIALVHPSIKSSEDSTDEIAFICEWQILVVHSELPVN